MILSSFDIHKVSNKYEQQVKRFSWKQKLKTDNKVLFERGGPNFYLAQAFHHKVWRGRIPSY